MSLSDLLLRLGSQAKDLEDSATSRRAGIDAQLKTRASELHETLSKVKVAIGQQLDADTDAASTRLTDLQRTISDGFQALRTEAEARMIDPTVKPRTTAQLAELDAEDAIDFALYALQEAEYFVLAAVAARDAGGEVADGETAVEDVVATDGETAVEDVVLTDGETAVEDVVVADGETAVEDVVVTDGETAVEDVVATDGETAVEDVVATDGETAVEDVVVADGETAVETVDTVDIDDAVTADAAPTK